MNKITLVPFDFTNPLEIKKQIKIELIKSGKTAKDLCEFCDMDLFHFYNSKAGESKIVVTVRKLTKFVKNLNSNFDIDWSDETHIITQLLNEAEKNGYKKVSDICRELKIPITSLYVNGAETKSINSLRRAVEFFNQ